MRVAYLIALAAAVALPAVVLPAVAQDAAAPAPAVPPPQPRPPPEWYAEPAREPPAPAARQARREPLRGDPHSVV